MLRVLGFEAARAVSVRGLIMWRAILAGIVLGMRDSRIACQNFGGWIGEMRLGKALGNSEREIQAERRGQLFADELAYTTALWVDTA